ncbi:thiopeptide-type bacteriocin biosynthesis protein [Flavobacterium sp.]|jgi:thiopeptide-type bacteriocin biosynthesis protein|uniref:thiopeptide-type bacteriocin biosynthesis protein n=1 Tax=Flavobacterium sp. TaxID=239 RepID=UPI00391D463C
MKRSFCIGSEWLYYKVYTGVKTADIVLCQKLYPIISTLKDAGVISKWFFIRYRDPDEHLRLRFLCDSGEKVSQVIHSLYPVFNELIENDLIWKLQTDTYNREIDRYGDSTIELSESVFFYDSEMMVNFVSLKPYLSDNKTELLFSFLAIDSFLNSLSLHNADKLALLDELQLSFKKEFQADKNLKKEFDKNYRELADTIDAFVSLSESDEYLRLYKLIQKKQNLVAIASPIIIANLEIPLFEFVQSHIHMMINRQYSSKQRMYECLIYDHLFRYYKMTNYKKASIKT